MNPSDTSLISYLSHICRPRCGPQSNVKGIHGNASLRCRRIHPFSSTTHVVTTRPVLSSSAPQTAPAGVNRQYTLRITGCLIREQPIRSAPHPTLDTWSPHFSRAPTLAPRLLAHCSALHCPFYPAGHQPFTSLPPRRAPPRSAASPSRRSFPLLSDSSIRHFTDHCMFPPLPPVLVEHVIIYSLCTSRASYLYIHSP